jgi:D-serine deaminase-like pyridoxal phosphate-dependent protein
MWEQICADGTVPTPFLALDYQRLRANLEAMAARVHGLGGRLWPHLKTHKSREIARLQARLGAGGATVATLAEAEMAIECGFTDLLVAYPPVPAARARAVAGLADRARVAVSCSEAGQVAFLGAAGTPVGVYWEVDVGSGRLGTAPGEETAQAVERMASASGAQYRGLLAFAGHAYRATSGEELRAVQAAQDEALRTTAEALARRGITGVLSVGTTPLSMVDTGLADEYRFGNYVFYDATQVALGSASIDQCALAVIGTVIGTPGPGRAVIDAGSKALPAERMSPLTPDLGLVYGHPEARVVGLYEEHGLLTFPPSDPLRLGDRVAVIPNHACTCVNLHGSYTVYSAGPGDSAERWPVTARHDR